VSLRVLVDGAPMADEAAQAFWKRFSAWMEEHRGDLGGFAQAEGLVSVHPQMHAGEAVLVASRSATQAPYSSAARGTPQEAPKGTPKGTGSAASPRVRPRETHRKRRR
jgi:hypothetical protein